MAEQRSALVNGIRLVYQVSGSQRSPTIVLLHALGAGHFVHANEPAKFTSVLLGWLGLAPMSNPVPNPMSKRN
jgi:pimeloyl-ACP methyl ester carboxylesterase